MAAGKDAAGPREGTGWVRHLRPGREAASAMASRLGRLMNGLRLLAAPFKDGVPRRPQWQRRDLYEVDSGSGPEERRNARRTETPDKLNRC